MFCANYPSACLNIRVREERRGRRERREKEEEEREKRGRGKEGARESLLLAGFLKRSLAVSYLLSLCRPLSLFSFDRCSHLSVVVCL